MATFGQTWTLDPAVKPFGTTVKKEAGKVVETSEEKDEGFLGKKMRSSLGSIGLCTLCIYNLRHYREEGSEN